MALRTYAFLKIRVIFVVFLIFLYVMLQLSIANETLSMQYQANSLLNYTRLSTKHGYFIEEHTVSTDDGYLLTIFHMVKSKKCFGKIKYPPVILMHGFLMSSDSWFDAGPEASLAYLLSHECFDIWLGNCRGNYYGRRHIKLNPDEDPEFWNFSADEMGMYDIPATVDYVIKYTGAKKVNYIGYSQGAGTFVIMCSERPGYSEKVGLFVALAPGTRLTHTQSRTFRALIDQFRIFENALTLLGVKEVLPKGGIGQALLSYICKYNILLETVCNARGTILMLDSEHVGSVNDKTWEMVFANFPAGTSLRTFARYGQSLWSERFQKFDHGESRNMKVYGTSDPPLYNISAVSTPSVIIYGKNDNIVDVRDIKWFTKSLPNVQELVEVEDPFWNHFDFMYSQYIKLMVFPKVLKYLTKFSL